MIYEQDRENASRDIKHNGVFFLPESRLLFAVLIGLAVVIFLYVSRKDLYSWSLLLSLQYYFIGVVISVGLWVAGARLSVSFLPAAISIMFLFLYVKDISNGDMPKLQNCYYHTQSTLGLKENILKDGVVMKYELSMLSYFNSLCLSRKSSKLITNQITNQNKLLYFYDWFYKKTIIAGRRRKKKEVEKHNTNCYHDIIRGKYRLICTDAAQVFTTKISRKG